MAVMTRWGTHLKQFKALIRMENHIMAVIFSTNPEITQYVPAEVSAIVKNTNFWAYLKTIAVFITPLVEAIEELEAAIDPNDFQGVQLKWADIRDPTRIWFAP